MDQVGMVGSVPVFNDKPSKFADSEVTSEKLQMDFLKLLTKQLEYQDPMSPLDNTQFTAQMAQFTSLSEQQKGNGLLEKLLQSMTTDHLNQGVAYIGKEVVVEGNNLEARDGRATVTLDLDEPATVSVTIFDAEGKRVHSIESRTLEAGRRQLAVEDPDLGEGSYTYAVSVLSGNEKAVTSLETGVVTGVVNGKDEVLLALNGRQVSLGDVRQVGLV
ncbi:MAG: flagellar hook assembly protein FlgD [Magnetococcales bacterium]|nr:flagellar hook assembly protein FlgD [Magnetococcales bacterium]MBF0155693.1 flagellar hook assembly protein FlgD [Magnetococcales bacterium]